MDDVSSETDGFPASLFYVTLFNILQGLFFSLLLLVFLTAQFSSTVKRTRTWFMFIGSIVEWCAAYLILFGHQTGDRPPVGLCAFQAAVIYSTTTFAPSAALAFELELFINLKALVNQTGRLSGKGTWGLVLFPPLVYFIMLIWVVTVGVSRPNQLERDGAHMFCHMRSPTSSEEPTLARPPVVSAVVAMLAGFLIVIFSVWNNVIIIQYKKKMGVSQSTSTSISLLSTSDLIRRNSFVIALTVLGIVMAITSFSRLSDANPAWNLALTGVPIATFFLFGTHMDLIRVWFCLSASPNQTTARLAPREQPAIRLVRIRTGSILTAGQSH
ncbi:hypothetical protein ARMGADRAFT_105458 [Armillaria gallica]|uniref:G-protein coupled receptors family 2 profile 2 domain-containing protein n=1 Tax=Armillaria gallica TaxID=47427 RepID=A0A2H3DEU4_ARMGA|nr:hypothetical protein ARMGADRAFT_105458 [Armillaria gallica]